jgi:hypothetical protein
VDFEVRDKEEGFLTNFCIDKKGKVRLALGIVNCIAELEDDENYVPQSRYEINSHAWNAHSEYIEMELPNPVTEPAMFHKIRAAMLAEFKRRLNQQVKNAKARLRRGAK